MCERGPPGHSWHASLQLRGGGGGDCVRDPSRSPGSSVPGSSERRMGPLHGVRGGRYGPHVCAPGKPACMHSSGVFSAGGLFVSFPSPDLMLAAACHLPPTFPLLPSLCHPRLQRVQVAEITEDLVRRASRSGQHPPSRPQAPGLCCGKHCNQQWAMPCFVCDHLTPPRAPQRRTLAVPLCRARTGQPPVLALPVTAPPRLTPRTIPRVSSCTAGPAPAAASTGGGWSCSTDGWCSSPHSHQQPQQLQRPGHRWRRRQRPPAGSRPGAGPRPWRVRASFRRAPATPWSAARTGRLCCSLWRPCRRRGAGTG